MKAYEIIDNSPAITNTFTLDDRIKWEEENPDWWKINDSLPERTVNLKKKISSRKSNKTAGKARLRSRKK